MSWKHASSTCVRKQKNEKKIKQKNESKIKQKSWKTYVRDWTASRSKTWNETETLRERERNREVSVRVDVSRWTAGSGALRGQQPATSGRKTASRMRIHAQVHARAHNTLRRFSPRFFPYFPALSLSLSLSRSRLYAGSALFVSAAVGRDCRFFDRTGRTTGRETFRRFRTLYRLRLCSAFFSFFFLYAIRRCFARRNYSVPVYDDGRMLNFWNNLSRRVVDSFI